MVELRLFDHQGEYVRTVYPLPAGKLDEVQGLNWVDFPQGKRLPMKLSKNQQTLLTSGDNCQGSARPIGGDEVSFFHAAFAATHTDRRLFVADIGNARIVSVKLQYHAEKKLALKDVPDQDVK